MSLLYIESFNRFICDVLNIGSMDFYRALENLDEIGEDLDYFTAVINDYGSEYYGNIFYGSDSAIKKGMDLSVLLFKKILDESNIEIAKIIEDSEAGKEYKNFDLRDEVYVYHNFFCSSFELDNKNLEDVYKNCIKGLDISLKLHFLLKNIGVI